MLSEERQQKILELLEQKSTVTVKELSETFDTSESTIRRDLAGMDKLGLLVKVHGGAASKERRFATEEKGMIEKHNLYSEEKNAVGIYAASLVRPGDLVYIDAGTTTESMLGYLSEYDAVYVTNGLFHAQMLVGRGFKTIVPAGEIRKRTEAIVGSETLDSLEKYNFSIGFFGSNGISIPEGYTTVDIVEAAVKRKAIAHCRSAYVLTDPSKFDEVYPVTFGSLSQAAIITNECLNKEYFDYTTIKETNNDLHRHI